MKWRLRLLINLLLTHGLPLIVFIGLVAHPAFEIHPWWAFLISLGIGILAALLHYGDILRPLIKIQRHAEASAEGNLQPQEIEDLPGIFEKIGIALNSMTSKLQEFLSRSQAETDVIAAEANRLRMILNSIRDGVFALDRNKRIILFNKAASTITGLEIKDVAGKHVNDVLPLMKNKHLVMSEWIDECQETDMQQRRWEGVTFPHQTGSNLSLDIEALYTGADPNGVRTLVTFHNRTEEQQIEDMKVDFVALAAHELRTPVTIIKGYIEILENELSDTLDPQYQEFIHKLDVSAGQLAGSINNILHVSHIEHGELNLNPETLNWSDIVESVVDELSQKASMQGKTIKTDIEENLPYVAADRISISEVVTNLIDNAIKYSERGQRIDVTVWHDETNKVIKTAVKDRGVGMPPNAIGKLFTKFYRSHRTRTSHRGTGLGLYMSKTIIEAHNGRIQVQSTEGKGSTFTFELPTVEKNDNQADNENITRGVHGWIKNHSLYKG